MWGGKNCRMTVLDLAKLLLLLHKVFRKKTKQTKKYNQGIGIKNKIARILFHRYIFFCELQTP